MKINWIKSITGRVRLALLIVKLCYWRRRSLHAFDELAKIRKLASNDRYPITFMAFDELTNGHFFDLAIVIHKLTFRIDEAKRELFRK